MTSQSAEASSSNHAESLRERLAQAVPEADRAPISLFVLRDSALLTLLFSLFGAAQSWAALSELGLAATVAVLNGLLVGTMAAFSFHEWGHFAGARLGGGHAPLKEISAYPLFFDFDYQNNSTRAFNWMGIGGNLAHWSLVLLLLYALPPSSPANAAIVAGAFGFAVFASVTEVPVIRKGLAGAESIEAMAAFESISLQRNIRIGVIAGLIALLFLYSVGG